MTKTPGAIPTKYGGVQFRSRLEARWAALFDRIGWQWEYEPLDFDRYIPDFVVFFPAGPVLVEVKPALTVTELKKAAAGKIDRCGWTSENTDDALIVGAVWDPSGHSDLSAGPLRQNPMWGGDGNDSGWGEGAWITCRECGRISVRQETHLWRCIACGAIGKVHGEPPELAPLWAEAGNTVQWRRPR